MTARSVAPRPAPAPDRDSLPFWDALRRHEFLLQRCTSCATWRFPPRGMCGRCGSFDASWQAPSGDATVASWVVTHHAFLPGFEVPYVVLTARLVEQPDLLIPGGYAGAVHDERLRLGAPVTADFQDVMTTDSPFTLLRWQPATEQKA